MRRLEQITAVALLLLAIAAFLGTSRLAIWAATSPGPRFMPLVVAAASALLAVLLFVDASRRVEDEPVEWPDREGLIRVGLTAAAIIAFIALAPLLGFVVGSAVFVLVLLIAVLRRPVVPSLATAATTAVIIQVVFVSWLGTALPRGILGL